MLCFVSDLFFYLGQTRGARSANGLGVVCVCCIVVGFGVVLVFLFVLFV